MRRLAVGLLAALLPAAAEAACPRETPRVSLRVIEVDPVLSTDATVGQLAAMSGHGGDQALSHLGLTSSRVEWANELSAAIGTGPEGACVVPVEVRLILAQGEHVVRIAREVPPGSCLQAEVLAHERRHVQVNRETLQQAGRMAESAATAWARSAQVLAATPDQAMDQLKHDLRRAIEPALAWMRDEQARRHALIDTPAEYQRLSTVCPADRAAVFSRLRGR